MEETLAIVANWVFPIDDSNRDILTDFVNNLEIGYPLTELFMSELVKSNNPLYLTEGALTTGAGCFFGSLLLGICQTGQIRNPDLIFRFASMYMIADHYLDDVTIGREEKKNFLSSVYDVMRGTTDKLNIENLEILADNFNYIVQKVPKARPIICEAIRKEIYSYHRQKDENLSEDEYLSIAEEKGGVTVQAIQALLELPVTQNEYELGVCIQLVDDLMDIDDDIALGISTIATHIHRTDGSIDRLFNMTIKRIDRLANCYGIFKPILIAMAIYSTVNSDKYSSALLTSLQKYLPFTDKTNIRQAFYEKLLGNYELCFDINRIKDILTSQ